MTSLGPMAWRRARLARSFASMSRGRKPASRTDRRATIAIPRIMTTCARTTTPCLHSRQPLSQSGEYPLYPRKRTLPQRKQMSALCQKQTLESGALFGGYSSIVVQPRTVGILPGNFWANPSRQFDLVVFVRQFDFGHNQPLIFTRKYVDFPVQLAVGN